MSVKFEFGPGISWYTKYRVRHMAEKMHVKSSRPIQVMLRHDWSSSQSLNRIYIPYNFFWIVDEADDFSLAHEFSHLQDKTILPKSLWSQIGVCSCVLAILGLGFGWGSEGLWKAKALKASAVVSCFCITNLLLRLSTLAHFRRKEERADKNALQYISTKEKVKAIVDFSYLQRDTPPSGGLFSTHPSDEKRIEWIKESIRREHVFLRLYAKTLLFFYICGSGLKVSL